MPPRRSTRSSLASGSGSTSSTPSIKDEVADSELTTPDTMATPSPRGAKRRASSPTSAPRKRVVLDSVAIPARRSKLGVEKTDSIDNLTLASARVKAEPDVFDADTTLVNSDTLVVDDNEDKPIAARRSRRSLTTTAKVVYAETDSEEDIKPLKRGRGKAKSKASLSDDEEFAMDSEDEMRPLHRAIAASKSTMQNGRIGSANSSASASASASTSVSPTSSRSTRSRSTPRKANGKANGHTLGGKTKGTTPHRVAVARAAELRARAARGERGSTADTFGSDAILVDSETSTLVGSGSSTPQPGSMSDDSSFSDFGGDEEDEESDLSDLDEVSDLSDESEDVPLKKGKGKAKAKAKKGKAKAKAKGQRLDGQEGDEMPSDWGSSPTPDNEEAKERRRQRTEKALIRSKEAKLKKELGRKLTQGEKNQIRLALHHPELVDCWGDLATNIEPVKPVPMEAHPSLKLTLLPFQKESLHWMKEQEKGVWAGGMLADEMGMGKTIQTIALLLSEPRRKPSLIVAPVVALMQWKNEIETHAEGLTVCLWHGSGRMKADQLKKFDVILVSYGTLEASFRRQQRGFKKGNLIIKEKSPMHTFEWYRVVLDEAHNIKERSTNAAKAAFALQAKYRWCLSGTPLQNRVGELYSLVRFLGADPFSYYFCKKCDCKSLHWQFSDKRHCDDCGHKPMDHVSLWNSEILTPIARYGIEVGGPGMTAFKKLKVLLDRMMLRRTKIERADDLGLPPRTIVVRRDYFSPPEKELYMSLFTNAKRQFNTYITQGTVLNNYSNIFSLITRMRQMACHPDLVLRSKTSSLNQVQNEGTVCRICNDTAEDAIVSACKHVFDRECIRQYLEVQQLRGHRPECPVCHIEISIDLEQEAIDLEESNKGARQGILSRLNLDNWRSSSKLEALVEELEKLRRQDCTIKSLVFSQFVSFLDLIAFRLQRAGFNICRLEGGMTPQQRDATIQHFMKNTHVTVFLISLKAGGVALNLTEASMVFMMDSWWNPSVEYQAMDRIHRLGQKRPVKVVKLVVEDSIEDQIVQLQAKKLAMTDAALSRDPDAALGKLTVEDLGFLFKL